MAVRVARPENRRPHRRDRTLSGGA